MDIIGALAGWIASDIAWIMLGLIAITVGPTIVAALARRRRVTGAAGESGDGRP